MTEQEIYTILSQALENLFEIAPERIKPEADLFADLEIDSIDAIDLIDHIKRETGHKLQAEDFRALLQMLCRQCSIRLRR